MTRKIGRILIAAVLCVLTLMMTACGKDNTPYTRGVWNGTTFTSTFLGLKVNAGSEWMIMNDEYLAKVIGVSDMSASTIQKTLDSGKYVPDMLMTKANGSSVNITVQDNDKSQIKFTEKEYFKSGPSIIELQMKQSGGTCTVQEGSVNFLGKSTRCLEVTAKISGREVYEIQVPMFVSHYMVSVTFGATTKAELYSAVAMMTAL